MFEMSVPLPRQTGELMADIFYDRLEQHIKHTQSELKANEQLLLYYYTHAGSPLLVDEIGYHNPHLIILYGQDVQGKECHVLLHMQSVELVLQIVEVKDGSKRRPLGFIGERKE